MIDIVIVTYNAKECLQRCLDALSRFTLSSDYHLIIINNASADGTADFLEAYRQEFPLAVVITLEENRGFCGAANYALRLATHEFIVLLDDDAQVTEGWLYSFLQTIRKGKNIGIVGGKIVDDNNRLMAADYRISPLAVLGRNEIDQGQRDYIKECDALVGTCWIMRRELIENVGFFDERFFPCQDEDVDYCLRVRLQGYKIVYHGGVKIWHRNLLRDLGMKKENRTLFLDKWANKLACFPLPDSHPADQYNASGIQLLRQQCWDAALAAFMKAGESGTCFLDLYSIGETLVGQGQYSEAVPWFEKLLGLNPEHAAARLLLGISWMNLGHIDKAHSFLNNLKGSDYHTFAQYHLMQFYYQQGQIGRSRNEAEGLLDAVFNNVKLQGTESF